MNNSGNNPGAGSQGGGSSHRRRSYRHFGPAGNAGQVPGGQTAGQQSQGGHRQPKSDNRENRENREAGNRRDQNQRSQQNRTAQQQPANQRQGNQPAQRQQAKPQQSAQTQGIQLKAQQSPQVNPPGSRQGSQQNLNRLGQPSTNRMPVIAGSRDDTEQNPVKDQQPAREFQERLIRHQNNQVMTQERISRWEKKIKTEETYEDIKRENERLEKEIWLEIAGIHTIKLD